MTFHVDSEVGRLRQVILHQPGLELSRLTPDNVRDLLFDDILWAKRAREEHYAFAAALRDRGITEAQLRTMTVDNPARAFAYRAVGQSPAARFPSTISR